LTSTHNASTTWTYNPGNTGAWVAPAPTTVGEALDRMAAQRLANFGPTP